MGIHWIILIALIVIIGQRALFRRWSLTKIEYDKSFDRTECYTGDEIELIERISNRKLLPTPWLRLETMMSAHLQTVGQADMAIDSGEIMQNHMSLFSLMPYTEITRRHQVTCLKRGYYFLNSTTITSGDLLGTVEVHEQLYVNCSILVYPLPIPVEEIPLPSSKWLGDLLVRRWIVEDPFFNQGVREYQAGDSMNSINWKATARSGNLQVNSRAFTADHKLMILLNIDDSTTMWNIVTNVELIEKGIVYVASLVDYVMNKGITTGFASNGRLVDGPLRTPIQIPCQTGPYHQRSIMEALAKLELKRSFPFEDLLGNIGRSSDSSTDCLIISAYTNEAIEREIQRLRSMGHTVDMIMLRDKPSKVMEDHYDEISAS